MATLRPHAGSVCLSGMRVSHPIGDRIRRNDGLVFGLYLQQLFHFSNPELRTVFFCYNSSNHGTTKQTLDHHALP